MILEEGYALKGVGMCIEGGGDLFKGGYVWKNVGMCLKGDMFGRMWGFV